jgi:divalent metal cation (Fe/Co/Zn/Cd) transporter
MILGIRLDAKSRDRFEKTALRMTGMSLYLVAAGLAVTAGYNISNHRTPESTLPGIVISIVSLLLTLLMKGKLHIGRKFDSNAIIADADCTKTCIYLSVILLSASALFELFHFIFIDSIGGLGIACFAFKEGRGAFGKASGAACSCAAKNGCTLVKE